MACAASSDGRVSVLTHDGTDDSWTVEYLSDTPLGVNSAGWAPYSVDAVNGQDGGNVIMIPSPPRIVTGGCDNCVRVWRKDDTTGTWEQEGFVSSDPGMGHKDWVRDVAWAPNVIPGTSVVASCSEDRTVIVWKQGVVGGGEGEGDEGDVRGGVWTPTLLNTFEDPVWRVSWVSWIS
jgi:protein transport protein SEC13